MAEAPIEAARGATATVVDVAAARGWLDAVEAALVAVAMAGRPGAEVAAGPHGLDADQAAAGLAAVAAKFLAVGTPRTLGLVAAGPRAADLLAAQIAYAAPRELRVYEPDPAVADATVAALAGPRLAARAVALPLACACDIVVVAGPIAIRRDWIRAGTLVTVLDPGAALEPALLAAAVVYAADDQAGAGHPGVHVHATLAAVAAGLVDGRSLDEITVLLPARPR